MSLLEYVECIDLREKARMTPFKNTWLRHTEERISLALQLARCVHMGKKPLRVCSLEVLPSNYRRLEDYAKAIGLVEYSRRERRWIAYGKLLEETMYYRYRSSKRPSWSRELEVRVTYPTWIDTPISGVELIDYADECVETHYGTELYHAMEKVKLGVREAINCSDNWCNGVCRVPLDEPFNVELEDARGLHYECTYMGGGV